MKRYLNARVTLELSQYTNEYKKYVSLSGIERQHYIISELIHHDKAYTNEYSNDFYTIEEAKENAYDLYHAIKEGYHMSYLFIEYYDIYEVTYDEYGDMIASEVVDTIY